MPVENASATTRAEEHASMQTLAPASFLIVMAAITHAKERGHCQVQPMHVAAALLNHTTRSIALQTACLQSLKGESHPLKCDALELCFKVALERLPVNADREKCKDQTMSNALAAALKRAHANERRGTPEQSLQPLLAVKTGTDHLTISILDDPSVSRVFREAGFSSTEVKTKMEEAVAQAALAGPPPPPPPSLDNTSMRRAQLAISPYCSSRLDGVQFRNSYFPGPSAFAAMDPSSRLFERGRTTLNVLDMQHPERVGSYVTSRLPRKEPDGASHPCASVAPQFLESALQQKRHEQARILSRQMDNSFRSCTKSHEAEVRKIVETLLCGSEKRNPVLLSDSESSSVVKEFSQRLFRDEFVPLRGVQLLELPITSLSVGMMGQQEVELKLAKLKRDVDGCMPRGGAIIAVGDLQWLLEPSHSISSLVLQELQQLMSSNAYNRLWLLAFASPKLFERCQLNSHPSLESLGLQPVYFSDDSHDSVLENRYGSYQSSKDAEIVFLNQMGSGRAPPVKLATIENGPEKSDCCFECNRKFQQECADLIKEEQTLSLPASGGSAIEYNSSGFPAFDRYPLLCNQKEKNRAPLRVKEEENLVTQRIEELRQKWQLKCSTHHLHPKSFLAGSPGSLRDHSSSPVSEVASPPQDSNPRMMHPLVSSSALSKPHPMKTLTAKPEGLAPLHARIVTGNIPIALLSCKPSYNSVNKRTEVIKKGYESGGAPLSWMRTDPGVAAGTTASIKPSILFPKSGHPGASVGTDLALGRASVQPMPLHTAHSRDLRETGQHPLHNRLQRPSNAKPFKTVPQSPMLRPSDVESLNCLSWDLSKSVPWQKEAVGAVASTVMKCRSGEGRKTGAYPRGDMWLMFLGPDRVGKREVARALAKLVFGREDHLILVTGWPSESAGSAASSSGILAADSNGVKYTGNTPLERLSEAVNRQRCSVVLLEDVDRADYMLRRNLLMAMESGKLQDSSGRDVSLANTIIIMTCDAGASFLVPRSGKRPIEFDEEKLSGLGPREVRLVIENTGRENVLHTKGTGLSIVDCVTGDQHMEPSQETRPAESILIFGSTVFKRKADTLDYSSNLCSPGKKSRSSREVSSPNIPFSLDLNLSAEENLSEEEEPCISDELSETSEWESLGELTAKVIRSARARFPREFFSLLDAAIVFKPFDLNGLTDWVFEKLDSSLGNVMQTKKAPVTIDRALMEVMVSSAWQNSSKPDAFQGWIDTVLIRAVSGALEKVSLGPESVVKLMGVEKRRVTPEFAPTSFPLGANVELLPSVIQVVGQ